MRNSLFKNQHLVVVTKRLLDVSKADHDKLMSVSDINSMTSSATLMSSQNLTQMSQFLIVMRINNQDLNRINEQILQQLRDDVNVYNIVNNIFKSIYEYIMH